MRLAFSLMSEDGQVQSPANGEFGAASMAWNAGGKMDELRSEVYGRLIAAKLTDTGWNAFSSAPRGSADLSLTLSFRSSSPKTRSCSTSPTSLTNVRPRTMAIRGGFFEHRHVTGGLRSAKSPKFSPDVAECAVDFIWA